MEVGTGAVLTVVGLLLLCFGGYALVSGGVAIAKKFQVSSLLIGLTVVAYGTSTPELAVSVASALVGETDLILGNVIGSNIANIGIAAFIARPNLAGFCDCLSCFMLNASLIQRL